MSGGEWKNAAMRLRDTAGNYLAAAVAYFEESDGPRYNHLKATARKLNDAIRYADGLAAEDKGKASARHAGWTCANCMWFAPRELSCFLHGEARGHFDTCSHFQGKVIGNNTEAENKDTTENTKQQEGETQE